MLFDEGEPTLTDRFLEPIRRAGTGTVALGVKIRRQAERETQSLLEGVGIPSPPEPLQRLAEWGGILITMVGVFAYLKRAGKKR